MNETPVRTTYMIRTSIIKIEAPPEQAERLVRVLEPDGWEQVTEEEFNKVKARRQDDE